MGINISTWSNEKEQDIFNVNMIKGVLNEEVRRTNSSIAFHDDRIHTYKIVSKSNWDTEKEKDQDSSVENNNISVFIEEEEFIQISNRTVRNEIEIR